MNRLIHLMVRNRLGFFAATVILMMITSVQMAHMAINGNLKVMFDEDNPHFQRLQQLENSYSSSNYLVFLFQPENKQLFTEQGIQQLQTLHNSVTQLPYVQRVDSLLNYPKLSVDNDDLYITDLIEKSKPITQRNAEEAERYLLQQKSGVKNLVSHQNNSAAIFASIRLPKQNYVAANFELEKSTQSLVQEFHQQFPTSTVHLNGDIAIEQGLLNVIKDDILRVNPMVFFTIFILVGLLLRSVMAIAATLTVVALSTAIATGINVTLGFEMNPITMMAPAIIMVLAVADSIHVLTLYTIECQKGTNPITAMEFSLKKNIKPIFWTSVTTIAGFMGLNFGDSPPFRAMGNMASVGVVFAFVCTFTALPFIALLFSTNNLRKPWSLTKHMAKLSHWRGHSNILLLSLVLLISMILASFIPKMQLNDDISDYFDDSLPIHHSIQFAKNNIEGVHTILYSLDAKQEKGIHNVEFLNGVDEFSQWLRGKPEVAQVTSYVDIIKQLNQAFHNNDPSYYRIPDNRQLNAQYFLLYEMALPGGMDLYRDVNQNQSQIKLTVSLHNSDNQTLLQLEKDIAHWLNKNQPHLLSMGSSELLIFAHLGSDILHSMMDGGFYTLIFITVFMMAAFRSVGFGLLSIIPNIFPAIVVYGIWSILVGHVNHAAAMTFTICLGLVVDDSIHLISKYLDSRRTGSSKQSALEYAFTTSGTTIVITTITLSCGILLLTLSYFSVNDTLAIMLAAIIVLALLFDLFVLPALLLLADRSKQYSTQLDHYSVNT